MGKIDLFEIHLERVGGVFFAGELIKGWLNIRVNQQLKIKRVEVEAKGFAYVSWSEEEKDSEGNSRTVWYTSQEDYLKNLIILMSKTGSDDLFLSVGYHSLPFEVLLPMNLPQSFEHNTGYIRYQLYATINIPWSFNKHAKRIITVLSHYDLNKFRILRLPYASSEAKMVCCGPCKSGAVIGTLQTPKSGYVPGEFIKFEATVENKSSRYVETMTLTLLQLMTFHASGSTNESYRELVKLNYTSNVEPNKKVAWKGDNLIKVPSVCATSDGQCKIINVRYELRLKFRPNGSTSKEVRIPITIGTIRIREEPSAPSMPDSTILNSDFSGDAPPSYDQLNFAESSFDNSRLPTNFDSDDKGEMFTSNDANFKPSYIYFN